MFTQELLTLAAREGLKVFIMKFTDWLVTSGGYMRLDCYGRRSLFWLVSSLSSLELSLFGTSPGKQTFVSLNTNGVPKSSCGIDPVIAQFAITINSNVCPHIRVLNTLMRESYA